MPRYRWNRYHDLEIDLTLFGLTAESDIIRLIKDESARWEDRIKDRRGEMSAALWVRIPKDRVQHLPWFLSHGFQMHHATEAYIMVVKPRSSRAVIPLYGTHYARVECVVVENNTGRVLLVQECNGPDSSYKLVTGSVDGNEYVSHAAVREVREETGVTCDVVGIIGLGNRLNTRFGRDELLVGVLLAAPEGQVPRGDGKETMNAAWMDPSAAITSVNHIAREWLISVAHSSFLPSTTTVVGGGGSLLLRRGTLPDFRGPPHSMEVFLPSSSSPVTTSLKKEETSQAMEQ
jgi:ADP-ribose pyrophosphatase YjhB (NUDIX family)